MSDIIKCPHCNNKRSITTALNRDEISIMNYISDYANPEDNEGDNPNNVMEEIHTVICPECNKEYYIIKHYKLTFEYMDTTIEGN